MAWKKASTVAEVRRSFLEAHERGVELSELCEHFGVSRSGAYALIARAKVAGVDAAVVDKSRAPLSSPHAIPAVAVERLLGLRTQFEFGPAKLAVLYEETFGVALSKSAIANVLRSHGLARPYRRRPRPSLKPLTEARAPNDCWAMDHKGAMGKQRVEPLTVIDQFSRCWLCCRPFTDRSYLDTRAACEALFTELGTPLVIRVDAGAPWAATTPSRLTRLSAWWLSLGIRTEVVSSCQQNGIVERLHGTMEREMSLDDVVDVRLHFEEKRALYNDVRPHESLNMRRPGQVYRRSPRRPKEQPPNYGACDEVRSVNNRGGIHWRGQEVYVSEALISFSVGLRQLTPKQWSIHFYDVIIGILDTDTSMMRAGV